MLLVAGITGKVMHLTSSGAWCIAAFDVGTMSMVYGSAPCIAAMDLGLLHVSLKEHAHICIRPCAKHTGGVRHLNGVNFICRWRPISPGTRRHPASSRGLDLHIDVADITRNTLAGCIISAAWPSHRWHPIVYVFDVSAPLAAATA
jgi:hypothetical protein